MGTPPQGCEKPHEEHDAVVGQASDSAGDEVRSQPPQGEVLNDEEEFASSRAAGTWGGQEREAEMDLEE